MAIKKNAPRTKSKTAQPRENVSSHEPPTYAELCQQLADSLQREEVKAAKLSASVNVASRGQRNREHQPRFMKREYHQSLAD